MCWFVCVGGAGRAGLLAAGWLFGFFLLPSRTRAWVSCRQTHRLLHPQQIIGQLVPVLRQLLMGGLRGLLHATAAVAVCPTRGSGLQQPFAMLWIH